MPHMSNETRLTRIQGLVVDILNELLRAPIAETDTVINSAISRIGDYCLRDRAYVFVSRDGLAYNTHEWCADGVDPMIEHLQGLPNDMFGEMIDILTGGDPYHVPDVSALPQGSYERELFEGQAISSILTVPMRSEGRLYGLIGFDGVQRTHEFLPGEIYLLKSVADVICTVLTRRETDHKVREAQDALKRERAFLSSVLETQAMGIIVMDGDGRIIFVNSKAEEIVCIPADKMLGRNVDDPQWRYKNIDEDPEQPRVSPFARVMATGTALEEVRFAMPLPDGTRFCAVHAAPVPDAGISVGNEIGDARVVYALVDVTAQVKAEQEREQALDDARRANVIKSQFLAKMSHEMRTPLNGVLGIAEVLEGLVTDPDHRRMVTLMHESGSLLLHIINDLLDMAKIEADQLELDQTTFSPSSLADRIEAVHTLKAAEKKLSFSVTGNFQTDEYRSGDPHRLLQILHNVISNAIKFTESGSVLVTLDTSDAEVLGITVRDTGIGMSQDQLGRLFDEFSQADSSIARRYGGTGLGMSIVRRLVDLMQGQVSVVSEPGKGTEVQIRVALPRVPAPGQAETTQGTVPEVDLTGLRILAADDNRTNRMILGAMMGQLGVTSVLVADGDQALEMFEREHFDAIILDISMPGRDGVQILHEMRARIAEGRTNRDPKDHLPILAFTANAMSHQIAAYRQAGFDDCLTKPLQIERLSRALAEHTRRTPPIAA